MGNFYTNITLRSQDTDRIVETLEQARRTAFVTEPRAGFSVVFDSDSEEQDIDEIHKVARQLSARLQCAALAVLNHDDDVLWYRLYERGDVVDEYVSAPHYFTDIGETPPEGGDAERLCRTFGAEGRIAEVEAVLRAAGGSRDGFAFEFERHQALVEALQLPVSAVAAGFNYLESGELPEGVEEGQLRRVG
ncbi:MAG TPA: hypothetical protein VF178_14830 [Gemmatimonadaceae bacterium]